LAPPNWGAGCEIELDFFDQEPTARGEYSTRRTNKDCTWFTPLSVPGNGRITSIRVGAGTGPTRIRFVVARSLQGQGGPAGGGSDGCLCPFDAGDGRRTALGGP